MSDPNTPVERQARRHRPAIWAIAAAILAAIIALFFFGAFDRDGMVEQSGGTAAPTTGVSEPAPGPAVTPPVTTTAPVNN